MATSHFFDGKTIKLPGAYSTVRSVSPASMATAPYSKLLLVNTDPSYAFGGSVEGELTTGGDAIYRLRSSQEARAFFKAGYLWTIVDALFNPSRLEGRVGVSELYVVNALHTVAPEIELACSNGTLKLKIKDECAWANGVKKSTTATQDTPDVNLKSGYAACIVAGTRDKSKFIVQMWQGTYKGEWTDNVSFDGVSVASSRPELVFASPECASFGDFVNWAQGNSDFAAGFVIDDVASVDMDAKFVTADIASNKFNLAVNGSATFTSVEADLEPALEYVKKLDYSAILPTAILGQTGSDAIHARLQLFAQSEAATPKYLAVAGSATFTANLSAAAKFDSERVWLIDNPIPRKSASYVPLGYREYDALYMAALVTGRILGLPPQVPGTFKDLDLDGLSAPRKEPLELEDALDAGVMCVHYDDDFQQYTIVRAINTLQNNTSIQNSDGSTFSIQISRICTQLNTDLAMNAKRELFRNNTGANINTVSPAHLQAWMEVFLSSKIATPLQDNLITAFGDISVSRKADAYYCEYRFNTNTEIAFAFFTGFAVN